MPGRFREFGPWNCNCVDYASSPGNGHGDYGDRIARERIKCIIFTHESLISNRALSTSLRMLRVFEKKVLGNDIQLHFMFQTWRRFMFIDKLH